MYVDVLSFLSHQAGIGRIAEAGEESLVYDGDVFSRWAFLLAS